MTNEKCLIPIGTIFNTDREAEDKSGYYRLDNVEEVKNSITITNIRDNSSTTYNLNSLNECLNNRIWIIVDSTPELEARLKPFNNIVSFDNFKRMTIFNDYQVYKLNLPVNGTNPIIISPGITGNCQLSVVGNMKALIFQSSDLRKQLIEVARAGNRKLLLCDIRKGAYNHLKKLVPDLIHTAQPYVSSNGSNMVTCIIYPSKK